MILAIVTQCTMIERYLSCEHSTILYLTDGNDCPKVSSLLAHASSMSITRERDLISWQAWIGRRCQRSASRFCRCLARRRSSQPFERQLQLWPRQLEHNADRVELIRWFSRVLDMHR